MGAFVRLLARMSIGRQQQQQQNFPYQKLLVQSFIKKKVIIISSRVTPLRRKSLFSAGCTRVSIYEFRKKINKNKWKPFHLHFVYCDKIKEKEKGIEEEEEGRKKNQSICFFCDYVFCVSTCCWYWNSCRRNKQKSPFWQAQVIVCSVYVGIVDVKRADYMEEEEEITE